MTEIRCKKCKRLLMLASKDMKNVPKEDITFEVKCPKCKCLNKI